VHLRFYDPAIDLNNAVETDRVVKSAIRNVQVPIFQARSRCLFMVLGMLHCHDGPGPKNLSF
jgi:hypothetical protein